MAKKQTKNIQNPAIPVRTPQTKTTGKKQEAPGKGFSATLKLALLLGVLSFAVYANTLKNGYTLDDFTVITENSIVTRGISAIPEILSTPYRRGWFITNNDLYRPLSLTMFAAEYQIFDKSPVAGHFLNILFFSGCVILLFFFLDNLFERKKTVVAFIASLLFALHPIHTEVVANIKSRDEIMCFFFAFLSLNIFLKYMQTGKMKQLIPGCLCFLLSLMSKETVITFLAIIPLIFFFYRNENKKYSLNITIGAVVMALVFLAIRYSVLKAYNANSSSDVSFIDNMLSSPPSVASGLATKILILGHYLKLLLIPYPLISDYSYNSIPFVTFSNLWVLLSLAIYCFLAWLGISGLLKNKKDPFAFAILFYLATISLFSNIPFLIGSPMAERFMFFTSVGFCLAVGLAIEKWILKSDAADLVSLRKPIVLAILISLSMVYAGITINRNTDWFDNYTLYKTDIIKSPDNIRLNYLLGTALAREVYANETDSIKKSRINEESMSYIRKALNLYPNYSEAQCNIGSMLRVSGKYREAIEHLAIAIKINPGFKLAYLNLAYCYFNLKQYDSAITNFQQVLIFDAKTPDVHLNLGAAYYYRNNYDSAIYYYKQALVLNPGNVNAAYNLGDLYVNLKNYAQAIIYSKKAISIDPNYIGAYSDLGHAYYFSGQYQQAIETIMKELALDKKSPDVQYIALSYQKMGNISEARKYEAIAKQNFTNFKLE